jgi:hypothetical protein
MPCFWFTTVIHCRLHATAQREVSWVEVRRPCWPSHRSISSYPSSFIIFVPKIPLPLCWNAEVLNPVVGTFVPVLQEAHPLKCSGESVKFQLALLALNSNTVLQMTCRTNSWSLPNTSRCGYTPAECETCGFHGSDCEDYCVLGCDDVWSCRYLPAFWRNLLPPSWGRKSKVVVIVTMWCSLVDICRRFGGICGLFLQGKRVNFEILNAFTMKISGLCYVTWCSLVDIYRCIGGTFCLPLQGRRVRLDYFSKVTMKILSSRIWRR